MSNPRYERPIRPGHSPVGMLQDLAVHLVGLGLDDLAPEQLPLGVDLEQVDIIVVFWIKSQPTPKDFWIWCATSVLETLCLPHRIGPLQHQALPLLPQRLPPA